MLPMLCSYTYYLFIVIGFAHVTIGYDFILVIIMVIILDLNAIVYN